MPGVGLRVCNKLIWGYSGFWLLHRSVRTSFEASALGLGLLHHVMLQLEELLVMMESNVLFCREEIEAQRGGVSCQRSEQIHGRARDANPECHSSGGGVSGVK